MRALVIGYGSIGARHARLLVELGCDVAVLSRREVEFPTVYADLPSAISDHRPEYIVVANQTSLHYPTYRELVGLAFEGRVLIEKPLFDVFRPRLAAKFHSVSVAYNLRFHPVIQRLREAIKGEIILSVHTYVGQYLPDWRPGTEYRQAYSAKIAQGGGVLRDLSHELDYLGWLFGSWKTVTALGGHVSSLEIDSDDLFVLVMQTCRCPIVNLQVSYLDRMARRQIVVNTERHTMEADLVRGTLVIDHEIEEFRVERDYTYNKMHRAIMDSDDTIVCTFEDGLATLQLIEAAESANRRKIWITR